MPSRSWSLRTAMGTTVVLAGVTAASGQTQVEGILEWLPATLCVETHVVHDLCGTGAPQWAVFSSTLDLDAYQCAYVRTEGADVEFCGDPVFDLSSVATSTAPCELQVRDLQVRDQAGTWLQWERLPCTGTYDIVRGDLPGPRIVGSLVDLGGVVCVANDTTDLSTFNGPRDMEIPQPERSFFYLVRGAGALGVTPYGFSSGGLEQVPAAGDCRS